MSNLIELKPSQHKRLHGQRSTNIKNLPAKFQNLAHAQHVLVGLPLEDRIEIRSRYQRGLGPMTQSEMRIIHAMLVELERATLPFHKWNGFGIGLRSWIIMEHHGLVMRGGYESPDISDADYAAAAAVLETLKKWENGDGFLVTEGEALLNAVFRARKALEEWADNVGMIVIRWFRVTESDLTDLLKRKRDAIANAQVAKQFKEKARKAVAKQIAEGGAPSHE